MFKKLVYEERLREGCGSLLISGLVFPKNKNFDPLAKIWSSVKKRIYEMYEVQVTGIFFYEPEKELILANFIINNAGINGHVEPEAHQKKFDDTFALQMSLFRDTLEAFLFDTEDGFLTYCRYLESTEDSPKTIEEECNQFFNNFLIKNGIKTQKDEKLKEKKKKLTNQQLKTVHY